MLVVVYEQCVMSFRVKGDPGIHSVARLASAKKSGSPRGSTVCLPVLRACFRCHMVSKTLLDVYI